MGVEPVFAGAKPPTVSWNAHAWNIFRYLGDYIHLFGVIALLGTLFKNQSCVGISHKTQIMYFLIFMTRYLDLFAHNQSAYLVFFKLTYMITSAIVLLIFWYWSATHEKRKDTCNIFVIILPCITAAFLLTSEYSALEVLWTFSEFLEGFAMVPQYIFCYRDGANSDLGVTTYVMATGGYRVFYAMNWIYKKIQVPSYFDLQSWLGGIVEICFFIDFLASRFGGTSLLKTTVLTVDEKINEVSDKVELAVLGSNRAIRDSEDDGFGGSELRQRRKGDDFGMAIDV